MDDRARIQIQAIHESGLLNVTTEGSHQGLFRSPLPVLPHELCLPALQDGSCSTQRREAIVRRHFSSALISGNDSWEPVLEQLWGERPERERKNINHQKFSWFNYGFFKKSYFLKFILLWILSLHHWLWILCIYLFKILSWVPPVCTLCVCNPDIARPPVGCQQSLFSPVPMQKNLHPETCLQQSKRQIAHSFSG